MWNNVKAKFRRPLSSLILEEGFVDSLISDANEFLDMEEWYADAGIPHRRGYLLYGPPGTGKSMYFQFDVPPFANLLCSFLASTVYAVVSSRFNCIPLGGIEPLPISFCEGRWTGPRDILSFSGFKFVSIFYFRFRHWLIAKSQHRRPLSTASCIFYPQAQSAIDRRYRLRVSITRRSWRIGGSSNSFIPRHRNSTLYDASPVQSDTVGSA